MGVRPCRIVGSGHNGVRSLASGRWLRSLASGRSA